MIAPVQQDYAGQIVELGAGNGALTLRLAARCPSARILSYEINPVLAQDVRRRVREAGLESRVQVVADSADHLPTDLQRRGSPKPDYVISGIPLGSLGRTRASRLIEVIAQSLRDEGLYIQFQHSLLDRNKIRARFSRIRTAFVLFNLPPAVVYYAQSSPGTGGAPTGASRSQKHAGARPLRAEAGNLTLAGASGRQPVRG